MRGDADETMAGWTNRRAGVLLVGHGTRSERGTEQCLALAAHLTRSLAPVPVETAFLELRQPDIDISVGRLVGRGIERLVTAPLLLFAAGHAKEDVPQAVAAALCRLGRQEIKHRLAAHLGCHPALLELSRMRFAEALANHGTLAPRPAPPRCTGALNKRRLCILVGRGSSDASATAEMYEFARLRASSDETTDYQVAFAAAAAPRLANVLADAASKGYGQVIVQPHLLFEGEVSDTLGEQTAAFAEKYPATQWVVTQVLADRPGNGTLATPFIEKVILDRVYQAGIRVVADDGEA